MFRKPIQTATFAGRYVPLALTATFSLAVLGGTILLAALYVRHSGRMQIIAQDARILYELWRSAPYLHDGSAATIREVLTTRNRGDQHGKTSHLTEQEINDLAEYLLSL